MKGLAMGDTLSRIGHTAEHFDRKPSIRNANIEGLYEECAYNISIPLNLSSDGKPEFNSLNIQTIYKGDIKQAVIFDKEKVYTKGSKYLPDRKHIGEFIFLLAARFRFDLLNGTKPDNAGFLHTGEIKRLKEKGITNVGPQIYRGISNSGLNNFTDKFLFEPHQLLHLICSLGYGGRDNSDIDLVFWLNLKPENILFTINRKPVQANKLLLCLKKLFPARCLLSKTKREQFVRRHIDADGPCPRSQQAPLGQLAAKLACDPRLEEFRQKLREQAEEALREKLVGREIEDYRSLMLEVGEMGRKALPDIHRPLPEDHNRVWRSFDVERIEAKKSKYILSSETGSGKTTFLRNLQLTMLENTKEIPLFFDATMFQELDFTNSNKDIFINSVGRLFEGYLDSGNENKFLKEHFSDIVFLIDGLDQVRDSQASYRQLLKKIFEFKSEGIIVSSRPFAVIDYEGDRDIQFLRLGGFSSEDQGRYFGNHFEQAKNICNTCPQMLSIPMLAHMVRVVIEENEDNNIKNRTGLYQSFIRHILSNHTNLNAGKVAKIRRALGKISFMAIAEEKLFQRIPLSYVAECLDQENIEIDELLQSGLTHAVCDKTEGVNECLYFTHQSFQEYLAAEYVNRNNDHYERVLKDKWAPHWKEVIKFLTGIRGEGVIRKMLSEPDNPIRSKLFLAAELVPETEVSAKVTQEIAQDIDDLPEALFVYQDALAYLACVDGTRAVGRLINMIKHADLRAEYTWSPIAPFDRKIRSIKDKIDNMAIEVLLASLLEIAEDKDQSHRSTVLYALALLKANVGDEVIEEQSHRLSKLAEDKGEGWFVRCAAIHALEEFNIKVNEDILSSILDTVYAGGETIDWWGGCEEIFMLGEKVKTHEEVMTKHIPCLLKIAEDKERKRDVRRAAMFVVGEHAKAGDAGMGRYLHRLLKIAERDEEWKIHKSAVNALWKFNIEVNNEVKEKYTQCLLQMAVDNNEDPQVRSLLIDALRELDINFMEENVSSGLLVLGGDDEDWSRHGSAIKSVSELDVEESNAVIEKYIRRLLEIAEDHDGDLRACTSAIEALHQIGVKVSDEVIETYTHHVLKNAEGKDREWVAYGSAINALWAVGIKASKEMIVKYMHPLLKVAENKREVPNMRHDAIHALRAISIEVSREVVDTFAHRLCKIAEDTGEPHEARISVIRALHALDIEVNDEWAASLLGIVEDRNENPYIRVLAIDHLQSPKTRIGNAIIAKYSSRLLEIVRNRSDNWEIRRGAINALLKYDVKIGGEFIDSLAEHLQDPEAYAVLRALYREGVLDA